jgi:hypothetical protein
LNKIELLMGVAIFMPKSPVSSKLPLVQAASQSITVSISGAESAQDIGVESARYTNAESVRRPETDPGEGSDYAGMFPAAVVD